MLGASPNNQKNKPLFTLLKFRSEVIMTMMMIGRSRTRRRTRIRTRSRMRMRRGGRGEEGVIGRKRDRGAGAKSWSHKAR